MANGKHRSWQFLAVSASLTLALVLVAFPIFSETPLAHDVYFAVSPEIGLTMASASGKFEYDPEKHELSVDGKKWVLDLASSVEIFSRDARVDLRSLDQLYDLIKLKATIVCTQAKADDHRGLVIRQAVVHLYD